MKNDDWRPVIQKMVQYCKDIHQLLEEYGHSFTLYKTKIAFQYSCNMCIIQIGELVNRLSDEFTETHPEIPWHAIKGMRNLHAHDYERVDLQIVWNTLEEEIPALQKQLENILESC